MYLTDSKWWVTHNRIYVVYALVVGIREYEFVVDSNFNANTLFPG